MKFSIKDFFSKCDQIRSFLRIWSHLLKKSLMENFIFRAVRPPLPHFLIQNYDGERENANLSLVTNILVRKNELLHMIE